MKPSLVAGLAVLAGITPALFAAESTATAPNARFLEGDDGEVAEVRKLGEYAINRLAMTLVSEVTVAVNKSGPEKAVDVCHLKALPLTKEGITGLPRIIEVKRTSLKLRNPANAPDAAEQLALDRVQKDLETGVPPKVLVQQVDLGSRKQWRVYRPVAVAPQCVTCHGPRETFSPELRAKLTEKYPSDSAVDYAVGQWRGLIRVTVADAPPAAPPPRKR